MKKSNINLKQAWFTMIRIKIKEHPRASFLINVLFFLPIPIVLTKLIISFIPKRIFKESPISKQEIKSLIGAKGILIDIKTSDRDHIYIKNI